MSFTNWGYIYLGDGSEDPAVDRVVIGRGALRTTIVAVPDPSVVVRVAEELFEAGAQSIELCGAFGPDLVTAVVEATGGRIPVGRVTYGMEAVHALAALFPLSDEGS
jgi:hypothetical protein